VPWHELRFEHTDAIRAKLLAGPYSRATVNVTLAALKGVLRQARRMSFMAAEDYSAAVEWDPLPPDNAIAGREVSQEEIERIQAYIATERGAYGAFLEAVFALLLGVGLREIEACRATVDAYDPEAGVIRVLRKGGKWAELPLGGAEVRALNEWIAVRETFATRVDATTLLLRVQPNDWVRPGSARCTEQMLIHLCHRVAKDAGVPPFRPHDLRRTFCTRALRYGDVFTVQGLMGHAKPETTRKYDRRTTEEVAAKRRTWNIWRPPEKPSEKPE
jgi:integrase/recombinase XerD